MGSLAAKLAAPLASRLARDAAQGLTSDPALAASILVNGAFAADTDWTKGAGWTISGGQALGAAGSQSILSQTVAPSIGEVYRCTFDVASFVAGTVHARFQGGVAVTYASVAANGSYTQYARTVAGNNLFAFQKDATGNLRVDNATLVLMRSSVDMVRNGGFASDSEWTKGTGWAIAAGVATHSGGSSGNISQPHDLLAGQLYELVYTVSGRTVGSLRPRLQGGTAVLGTSQTTNATFSEYLTAVDGNNLVMFVSDATFDGSIDNVSLRRIY